MDFMGEPVVLSLDGTRSEQGVLARLRVDVSPGFHLYAPSSDEGIPFSIEVGPTSALSLAGPPKFPESSGRLYGSFEVQIPLEGDASDVEIVVGYQACDPQMCLMPSRQTVRCTVSEPQRRG